MMVMKFSGHKFSSCLFQEIALEFASNVEGFLYWYFLLNIYIYIGGHVSIVNWFYVITREENKCVYI